MLLIVWAAVAPAVNLFCCSIGHITGLNLPPHVKLRALCYSAGRFSVYDQYNWHVAASEGILTINLNIICSSTWALCCDSVEQLQSLIFRFQRIAHMQSSLGPWLVFIWAKGKCRLQRSVTVDHIEALSNWIMLMWDGLFQKRPSDVLENIRLLTFSGNQNRCFTEKELIHFYSFANNLTQLLHEKQRHQNKQEHNLSTLQNKYSIVKCTVFGFHIKWIKNDKLTATMSGTKKKQKQRR